MNTPFLDRYGVVYARAPGIVVKGPLLTTIGNSAILGIEILTTLPRYAIGFCAVAHLLSAEAHVEEALALVSRGRIKRLGAVALAVRQEIYSGPD